MEAGKEKLSPTVDSVIKSLGLVDEEEEKLPTTREQLKSTLKTVVLPK